MAWRYDEAKIERQRAERERQDMVEMDTAPAASGLCYFFGGTAGILKIGYTRSIWQRINRLKGSCGPYKMGLLAVAPGGSTRERHYHRMFDQHAVGGEWFNRVPEIDAEIAALNEKFGLPDRWGDLPARLPANEGRHNAIGARHG